MSQQATDQTQTMNNDASTDQFAGLNTSSEAPAKVEALAELEAKDRQATFEGIEEGGEEDHSDSSDSSSTTGTGVPSVSFSDFLKKKSGEDSEVDPDTIKKESKKEDETENQDTQPVTAPTNKDKIARDYTGIEEADKPKFAKMSREAFELAKSNYIELRQLKAEAAKPKTVDPTALPASYYEHPEGYALSPSYRTQEVRASVAGSIAEHYVDQVAAIEAGENWTKVVKINPDGSLGLSEPYEPSNEAKKMVLREMYSTQSQARAEQDKLQQLIGSFKSKHQESLSALKQINDQYFKGYDDKKHPSQALRKEILAQLPETYRDHPVSDLMAKAAYNNAVLLNQVAALKAKLAKYEPANGNSATNGKPLNGTQQQNPSAKNFNAGRPSNGQFVPKFSDFKNRD